MAASSARNPKTEAALHSSITKIVKDYRNKKAQLSSKASIYRVPQKLRKLKESAYTPRIVSIGPYHKHDERLKDMEDQKKSYTSSLLSRVIEPGQTTDAAIKEITNKILDKAADARSCYAATHELDDDVRRQKADQPQNVDLILGNTLVFLDVRNDLLLLENQIPMFVLQTLFDFSLVQAVQPHPLFDLIISFFGNMLNFKLKIRKVVMPETAAHILGLLHDCYLPCDTAALERQNTNQIIKHSAVDLDRAGVDFKEGKGRDQICLFGRTCFEIPKLCIYDSTEPFLRNLIAFEQCSPSIPRHITSYAFLMDTLINTKDDVEVLEKAGVLENHLAASEDATRLFNTICKEVVLGEFTFWKQWCDVEKYCNSEWPSHLASPRRDYFSSPWALISVIAALILFALTVLQTVYTVRAG
ncbi:hypothetical protein RJ639_016926 [Escallonia herrerae]|uniref:Uncharacterized protein n=1 Tax=Escallonia herrerae TaxID=1293975 RepID=A0AA88VCZ0_9ASTE|nr:hypothetical protein RJ639_016926 [Escallonia herrerae]